MLTARALPRPHAPPQSESGAILLYLADKWGQLRSPAERARAAQWALFANSTMSNSLFVEQVGEGTRAWQDFGTAPVYVTRPVTWPHGRQGGRRRVRGAGGAQGYRMKRREARSELKESMRPGGVVKATEGNTEQIT